MGNEQFIRGMWEYFTLKRAEVRKILADASLEKQEGYKVSGNMTLPQERFWSKSKEVRIQIAVPNDVARFPSNEERQLGTSKERYWKEEKSSEWTLERTREVHEKVAKDTVAGHSEEEHGLLAAGRCGSRWNGRSHFFVRLSALQQFSFGRLHLVGIDGTRRRQQQKKHCSWWCEVSGGKYEWKAPNRILVVQLGTSLVQGVQSARCATGLCEKLGNALELQTDDNSAIQSIVTCLHERN